jgi:hypothetical protein
MKGKILEYIVRKILYNCGFTSVESDDLYIYDRHPLQMINGRGTAHDADVLMNPPVQMPFSYPTRIIYECKAYNSIRKVGLNIIRSAYGLRSDINDFEIIKEEFLLARRNNHRALLAISPRKRHYYQVGVATLFDFSKPALEFAANNKIPLLSIDELFRGTGLAQIIDDIPTNIVDLIGQGNYERINQELSKKNIDQIDMPYVRSIYSQNNTLTRCFELITEHIDKVYTGILESGELIFIRRRAENPTDRDVLRSMDTNILRAQLHWEEPERERWTITFGAGEAEYYFYLPGEIAEMWKSYNDTKASALQIKNERFARFFIFNRVTPNEVQNIEIMPFKLVLLDKEWLQQLIDRQSEQST